MIYKILNNRISKKISRAHPVAVKYLMDDLKGVNNKIVAERLQIVRNHALLHKHFETDYKRLYMINRNYLNFIEAVIFLYHTGDMSVKAGIVLAPSEVYRTINSVQSSFAEATKSLSLK